MSEPRYLIARYNTKTGASAENPNYYLGADYRIYHPEDGMPVPDAAYFQDKSRAAVLASENNNGPWKAEVVSVEENANE